MIIKFDGLEGEHKMAEYGSDYSTIEARVLDVNNTDLGISGGYVIEGGTLLQVILSWQYGTGISGGFTGTGWHIDLGNSPFVESDDEELNAKLDNMGPNEIRNYIDNALANWNVNEKAAFLNTHAVDNCVSYSVVSNS